MIHTSGAVGAGRNRIIELLSPPRLGFSLNPGWVVGAEDYPLPPSSV